MTTRHGSRLKPLAAAAAAAGALIIAGPAAPASAAVPKAAQQWASLMHRSLTPTPQVLALREKLAGQRATLVTRSAGVTKSKTTQTGAQTALSAAITADGTARTRYAVAVEALTTAKNARTVALQQRPRNATKVSRAQAAVTAAAKTVTTSRTAAAAAARTLKTAQGTARTATADLDTAIASWRVMSEAVATNQERLAGLNKAPEYATQAAALSRDVVAQVRPVFTTADTTAVNGVTVHKSVSFAFREMLAAAKADGVVLSGGGFRTKQRQIELRKINGCPDVYTAPASSCRVPTAIPGKSLHELGLAVDITQGGSSLTSSSAGFRWLSVHADEYGFVNLPSEPWHWSITGG
jgi:zinc D-Ala-D-Ala carboxypeptidase